MDAIRDLLRRLLALEESAAIYRTGVIASLSPLSVSLGGSDVPYANVRAICPVEVGDTVAVLTFGRGLLVLGRLTTNQPRFVAGSVAGDGTESSPRFSVTHTAASGDYTVTFTNAFPVAPEVIVGVGPSATFHYAKLHASTPPSTTGFRVICLAIDGGAVLDGAFTFIATT